MDLQGKVALITGASSGIGRATAKLFAHKGAQVVIGARRNIELETLVSEIRTKGGQAIAVCGDVRDEDFSRSLVDTALQEFGGLDIAFNNAGSLGELGDPTEISLSGWLDTLNTNLTSAFLGAKHQLPALLNRGKGSLIFTSSFVGHTVGFPGMSPYAAAKSGIIGLMKNLASEYGAQGIRVNALLPGATDTPMGKVATSSPGALDYITSIHALKRMTQPEEIARSALYLASDSSSFMTGNALLVEGGVSIYKA